MTTTPRPAPTREEIERNPLIADSKARLIQWAMALEGLPNGPNCASDLIVAAERLDRADMDVGFYKAQCATLLDRAEAAERVANKAENALFNLETEISGAIGSNRFLDPPDGGSVTFAEQVTRMRQALETAEKRACFFEEAVAPLKSVAEKLEAAERSEQEALALADARCNEKAFVEEALAKAEKERDDLAEDCKAQRDEWVSVCRERDAAERLGSRGGLSVFGTPEAIAALEAEFVELRTALAVEREKNARLQSLFKSEAVLISERDDADNAIARITQSLSGPDEWADQRSMIADAERRVAELFSRAEAAEKERDFAIDNANDLRGRLADERGNYQAALAAEREKADEWKQKAESAAQMQRAVSARECDYILKLNAARAEALEEAAKVAKDHNGAAKRKRAENMVLRSSMRFASDEARAEIFAEERGEDIAAEIIEREIRALANQPKEQKP